jgi:hypothetical protein
MFFVVRQKKPNSLAQRTIRVLPRPSQSGQRVFNYVRPVRDTGESQNVDLLGS